MKHDTLKYCLYCKGEIVNPFEYFSNEWRWWFYENIYFIKGTYDEEHKKWEDLANKTKDSIEPIRHLMNDELVPIETKGLLAFSVATTMNQVPTEDFEFFREYGKGIFDDMIYNGTIPEYCESFASLPEKNKARIKKNLISECRFYKGEAANPFELTAIESTFWEIEYLWVNQMFLDDRVRNEYTNEFTNAFPNWLNEINKDIPLTLKAMLYAQFKMQGGEDQYFTPVFLQYVESALLVNS